MRKPIYSASIIKSDGTELATEDYGIFIKNISIPSPYLVPETEEITGGTRLLPLGGRMARDPITIDFDFRAYDIQDYNLLRHQVFALFHSKKPFYFIDHIEKGKRWYVYAEGFRPEEVMNRGKSSVSLVPLNVYAESIGTTLDPFTYDSGLWSYGMGLQMDASTQDYVHTTSAFSIFNAGSVEVNPRYDALKITLKSISATGNDITIRNNTNGKEWRYQGIFQSGDIITIDGILTKRNGLNAVGETGPLFGLISLAEGNNDFTITGLTGEFEITFEFPFLYV